MKKNLLFAFALIFTLTNVNAQRVLLDFDTEQQFFFECFGNGAQGGQACFDVIFNPDQSGINTTDSVGVFIEPAEGDPWAGFFFDIVNGGDVDLTVAGGETMLCADVWVSDLAPFTFKVENTGNGAAPYEGIQVMPSAAGQWVTVCDDMATFNNVANRLVLFFNIGAVPTVETSYYFDNVNQPGTSSVGGLIEEKGLRVYPNPATYNLLFNSDGEPMTVIVSDLNGCEMIHNKNFTGNNIRVADLTPGMYTVTFVEESTGRSGSTKFVKN